MKIYIPEPAIAHNEGFSVHADIFQRKQFGERLANLVRSCKDGFVLALDSQWGEGKSSFIKMWQGHIGQNAQNPIRSLYFDAFANVHQKDPFLALAGELYEMIIDEDEEKKTVFKEKAMGVAKSLARGATKIGTRTTSSCGFKNGSSVDSMEHNISDLLADQVDSIIADKLENAKKDKLAINSFRAYLKTFAQDYGNGAPIVFIIDELDRCRPEFALDLLEQIKHLFSVPGIVFLLVLNRVSLEETIKSRCGSGVCAVQYLQKFINLWLNLPTKSGHYHQSSQYIDYLLKQMLEDGEIYFDEVAQKLLNDLSRLKSLSCRQIERILSYLAMTYNMGLLKDLGFEYQLIIAFVCYLKVIKPQLIERIIHKNIESKELLEAADISSTKDNMHDSYIDQLRLLVRYDLGDEPTKYSLQEFNGQLRYVPTNMLLTVCEWMSTISR